MYYIHGEPYNNEVFARNLHIAEYQEWPDL